MADDDAPPEDSMQMPRSLGREARRTLAKATSRADQRRRLVHTLAFALFLITIAAAPGYLGPTPRIGSLLTLGATAGICVLSYLVDRLGKSVTGAAYVLVVGGALVTLAHVGVAALSGDVFATDQAALFLLPVIFAAGVLFTVEVIVLLLVLSMSLTGAALFFALAQSQQVPSSEIYLMMVTTLGLQALLGLIAALVAQFLQESGYEVQRSSQARWAQAQIKTLQREQTRREESLRAEIKVLQEAITRVLAGTQVTGVPVLNGELAALMQSFNLLLDYVHSRTAGATTAVTDDVIRQMLEIIGLINEGSPTVAHDVQTQTTGALDTVMQALLHLQARSAHRFAHMRELISDVGGAVKTGIDGLGNTSTNMEAATRLAGKVVSMASELLPAIKTSHALVMQARDHVGRLLPPQLLQAAAADAIHRDAGDLTPEEAARLLGRYDDLVGIDILDSPATDEFEALPPHADGQPDLVIPPLTMRLPAVGDVTGGKGASGGQSEEARQAQLLELWSMLDRMVATLAYEYRTLQSLTRDLGKLSRTVRNADAGVVHGIASMEASSEALKDLQDAARPGRGTAHPDAPRASHSSHSTQAPPSRTSPEPSATQQAMPPTMPSSANSGPADPTRGTDPNLEAQTRGMLSADDLFRGGPDISHFDLNQLIDPDLREGNSNTDN